MALRNKIAIPAKVAENQAFLNRIIQTHRASDKQSLLEQASSEQLLALVEICLNVLHSKINLAPDMKKKLYKHRNIIRRLSQSKSEKKARQIVSQTGAGIAISALLIPVLTEIASHILEKI